MVGDVNVKTRTGRWVHRAFDYGPSWTHRYDPICHRSQRWHRYAVVEDAVTCPGCLHRMIARLTPRPAT